MRGLLLEPVDSRVQLHVPRVGKRGRIRPQAGTTRARLQIDVVGDDPEPVRLEDHDRLAAADSLREAVDPGDVLGGVRRAAGGELPAVAVRDVVGDENGNAALERGRLHRLAHLLLHLGRRAAGEPDCMALRDHRPELQRTLHVAVHEQVDSLPHCVRAWRGHVEAGRRIERSRLGGARRGGCQDDHRDCDDGAAERRPSHVPHGLPPQVGCHVKVYIGARVPYSPPAVKPEGRRSRQALRGAARRLRPRCRGDRDTEQAPPLPPADDDLDPVLVEQPPLERQRDRRRRPRRPTSAGRALRHRAAGDRGTRRQAAGSAPGRARGGHRSRPARSGMRPDRAFPASRAARQSSPRRRSPTRSTSGSIHGLVLRPRPKKPGSLRRAEPLVAVPGVDVCPEPFQIERQLSGCVRAVDDREDAGLTRCGADLLDRKHQRRR